MTDGNDEYKVGYRRPPLDSRFKKGRSGNPNGRKVKPSSIFTSLRDLLAEPQTVQMAGRRVRMATGHILIRKQVEKAIQGDFRTAKMLLEFVAKSELIDPTKTPALDIRGAREELARKLGALMDDSDPDT